MSDRSIWIPTPTHLTADLICQTAMRHQMVHPETALVVVDWVDRLQGNDRHDLAMGDISRALKSPAKENQVPAIPLSQLYRGVEPSSNKRPINSDLKNSGEIEANADIILMLYRDEV